MRSQIIDERTIDILKYNDKYKLFKLYIGINGADQNRVNLVSKMLDEMPDFEIECIEIWSGNNDIINLLSKKPMFKTEEDFYDILEFNDDKAADQSDPHHYLSDIYFANNHNMSNYATRAGCIWIRSLENDMNIDCETEKLEINSRCFKNIRQFKLGSEKFMNSVDTVSISYLEPADLLTISKNINHMVWIFKNLKHIQLTYRNSLTLSQIIKILMNYKVNQLSIGDHFIWDDKFRIKSEVG